MYTSEYISNENLPSLSELSLKKEEFNELNKDVVEFYKESNIFRKILLKRKVHLLKNEKEYIGFIWITQDSFKNIKIQSMYVKEEYGYKGYQELLKCILNNNKSNIIYECVETSYNTRILDKLNFIRHEGIIVMELSLENYEVSNFTSDKIQFKTFTKYKDEEIRCGLQNEIFKSSNRIALKVEDIIFDENQEYYLNEGSIFLLYNGQYIGYGQIIKESNKLSIVNFGLVEKYRKLGYGTILLNYLIKLAKHYGHPKLYLKVDYENYAAQKLYYRLGFRDIQIYRIYSYEG